MIRVFDVQDGTEMVVKDDGVPTGPSNFLTADLNLYIRTDGSDTNKGLANTAGGAFRTIGKATDSLAGKFFGPYKVTIYIADGVYATEDIQLNNLTVGATYPIYIRGNSANLKNVIVKRIFVNGTNADIDGITMNIGVFVSNGSYATLLNSRFATTQVGQGCTLDPEICAVWPGVPANYYGRVFFSYSGGLLTTYGITIEAGVIVGQGFAVAENGEIDFYNMPTGTFTGKRFSATFNGIINTYGAGVNALPGTVAGTTSSGGQYV